ncbi:hypothetical protein [Fictibacillus sp. JL2B1089]|uniref:hypothetical protein n=1 Tax=Fictibacillus sp. JL2B1089 TaxID=3399565 RepID=UPI003A85594C
MNIYYLEKMLKLKKREMEQFVKENGRPKQIKSNTFIRSPFVKRKTLSNQVCCVD